MSTETINPTGAMTIASDTPIRPNQRGLRAWAQEHGVAVPPKGKPSNAAWAKWDEWYIDETSAATTKLKAAVARAQKAYEVATAHVQKHLDA